MSNIIPLSTHPARATSRALAQLTKQTEIAVAHVASATAVETATLDGLEIVAGRAMQGVAMVSQLEQQLAQAVPLAASRLQAIGDMHALASANVVSSASRPLS